MQINEISKGQVQCKNGKKVMLEHNIATDIFKSWTNTFSKFETGLRLWPFVLNVNEYSWNF